MDSRISRRHSSGSDAGGSRSREFFHRTVEGRKVIYKFNATYRKPSDSGWVFETHEKSSRKKSDSEQKVENTKNDMLDKKEDELNTTELNQR